MVDRTPRAAAVSRKGRSGRKATVPPALRLLPAIVWAFVIFWLSSMSQPPEPGPVADLPGWTSLAHFGEYFILGALLFLAGGTFRDWRPSNMYIMAMFIGAIYGITDELHQSFVPGREMDALDWLVDCLGVSSGALIPLVMKLSRRGKAAHE